MLQRSGRIATPSSRSSTDQEPILVGEIVKPHGLRGEVVVASYSENPDRFVPGITFSASGNSGLLSQHKVLEVRPHLGKLIVLFEGVQSRDDAEALRGTKLFVSQDEVSVPEEGAYWEHQIIGLEVFDVSGEQLGVISNVLSGAGQDLWEVTSGDRSFLLPAVEAFVTKIDLDAGRVEVSVPPGLVE